MIKIEKSTKTKLYPGSLFHNNNTNSQVLTFCIKCLLFLISFQHPPKLHHDHHCLPSHHSFSPWGSKMIQLVLDRVWFEFKGKSQSKLMENPSSWNLDLDVQLGVVQINLVKWCTKPEIKLFFWLLDGIFAAN